MVKITSEKDFNLKLHELSERIKACAVPFADNSLKAKLERINKAKDDIFYFALTYLPHYASKPFGDFHREIHEQTSDAGKITAIAGPRAHGKTVLLAIIKPLWEIFTGRSKFIVFISDNEDLAKERTAAIKMELITNERIKADYNLEVQLVLSENDFTLKNGVRCLAMGYKQPIRGKINRSNRPDLIILDDYESHLAFNPKIAKNKLAYVRGDVFGALSKLGKVIWLGNLTHKQSALAMFKVACEAEPNNNSIRFLKYRAVNDNKPLWPQGFSILELENMRQAMGNIEFERHMQQNPVVEGVIFKSQWLNYAVLPPDARPNYVAYCDPGLSKGGGDYKAIIVTALHNERYYIVDCWVRKATIDDMLHKLYNYDNLYKPRIYMESTLWQTLLWDFIPALSHIYGYLLPVSGINHRLKKEERIFRLQPLYERGWIYHPPNRTPDLDNLEEQLLHFPEHAHDDGPDALAEAIELIPTANAKIEYLSIAKSQKFSL